MGCCFSSDATASTKVHPIVGGTVQVQEVRVQPPRQQPPCQQPPRQASSDAQWWKEPSQPVFIQRRPEERKVWKVKVKTLVVRMRASLKSNKKKKRLKRGAVIEQLKAQGRRIRFRKISGKGPKTGWISKRHKKGKWFLQKHSPPRPLAKAMTALAPLSTSTGMPDFNRPPLGVLSSCPDYIKQASSAMPQVKYIDDVIREAKQVSRDLSSQHKVKQWMGSKGVSFDELFAIVMYTFDICLTGRNSVPEDNFYYQLNKILRNQNAGEVTMCHGYIYYLVQALNKLPPYRGEDEDYDDDADSDTGSSVYDSGSDDSDDEDEVCIFRGMDRKGKDAVVGQYMQGKEVLWPAFTSFGKDEDNALDFVANQGLLIELEIKQSKSQLRDISWLSAFGEQENEVLALPNFRAVVQEAPYFDSENGFWVTCLKEK